MRFGEIDQDQLQNVRRPSNRREKRVRHFIDWVSKRIGLKDTDIDITFSYDKADAQDQHRTGQFDWHNKKILVYVGNRNMVDILRTVCHELQHVKQNEDGRIKKYTGPGSPLEVEADAVAGYLMKLYGKLHRDIFEEVNAIQIQQGPDISPELRRYKERGTLDTFGGADREPGAQDLIGGGSPRVKNILATTGIKTGAPSSMLSGRNPATNKDITYAQRKVSQQELNDIKSLGYAVPPVAGTKFSKSDQPEKWWSPADAQGQFGRNWNKGDVTIRVPIDRLPAKKAVAAHELEIQDPKTGVWRSLMRK